MKISYNWLRDYVDIKIAATRLAGLMTMAGLEVTAMERIGSDTVFEIEVTPNRPDCLSIIGVAREIAALTNSRLKEPKVILSKDSKNSGLRFMLTVIDKRGCSRYIGRSIADVKVGPSPEWLRRRLESVGIRSINNIVDITNYVLLETGQPLHAFDLDKLAKAKIIVRRAKADERIITIDGQERKLDPEILVIADAYKPVAIAGVMGGLETEVSTDTKNILLESAYFDPVLIRRTSRALGLSSESSYRFERGTNPYSASTASMRAVNLIEQLAQAKLIHSQEYVGQKVNTKTRRLLFSVSNANNLLGTAISSLRMSSILKRLGFGVSVKSSDILQIRIPFFRQDVKIEVDLVEEIARIYGYNRILSTIPKIRIADVDKQPLEEAFRIIKEILIGQGFNEVITYSLMGSDLLQKANIDCDNLTAIANPLSAEQEFLRPALLPGLLNCAADNFHQKVDNIKIFELGNIAEKTAEIPALGIVMSGLKYSDWLRRIQEPLSLFDLKGIIEAVLQKLGIGNYDMLKRDLPYFKKGYSATVKIQDVQVGFLGRICDELMDRWSVKKKEIFVAELNIRQLSRFINLKKIYRPWINFPSIRRDISLIMHRGTTAADIIRIARQEGGVYLKRISLVEQYTGEHIPAGSNGLVFSLEYQASDRTLTDEEVNAFHRNICEALKNTIGVKIR
jgi:phenylalanyl-tRNA synthetase beta chain